MELQRMTDGDWQDFATVSERKCPPYIVRDLKLGGWPAVCIVDVRGIAICVPQCEGEPMQCFSKALPYEEAKALALGLTNDLFSATLSACGFVRYKV